MKRSFPNLRFIDVNGNEVYIKDILILSVYRLKLKFQNKQGLSKESICVIIYANDIYFDEVNYV